MKKKIILYLLGALGLGVILGRSLTSSSPRSLPEPPARRLYAMNVVYSAWPGWQVPMNILKRISEVTPGLQTSFGGTPDGDPSKQIEMLDALIAQKVSGIIICPGDSKTLRPTINKVVSKGIPVVTMFDDVDGSGRSTFITSANRATARKLAERIIQKTKPTESPHEQTEVLISFMKPGISNQDERLAGVKQALEDAPWLKLVDVVRDEADDAKGTEVISAALTRNPDLQIVFGIDSRAATGAIAAFKERGIAKGQIIITGWDSDEDVLRGVQDGWVKAVSAPNIGYMTKLSVAILEAQTLGYLKPGVGEVHLPSIPDKIDIAQTLVTASNVLDILNKGAK